MAAHDQERAARLQKSFNLIVQCLFAKLGHGCEDVQATLSAIQTRGHASTALSDTAPSNRIYVREDPLLLVDTPAPPVTSAVLLAGLGQLHSTITIPQAALLVPSLCEALAKHGRLLLAMHSSRRGCRLGWLGRLSRGVVEDKLLRILDRSTLVTLRQGCEA